ncbi:hypothetical protein HN807_04595 [Candidatus Bathyarchaeota archaeon]|jgi:hypothetical protein|nr:hypothetical protein [Candidatus Bathyarchaeota archaeon]MBT4319425.1 hypothetical protein [Candidatus Bathyarchaeota archaeon]MBT4422937.1 hypothetical protein [Candidatus Bathyarchaeota archaeon]MBT5641706.1 hypothetical protein [Candidatus Bathyarchaeota archaeon]MBT6603793.1 hypothetical protein [Candidatus Bathyarchaeota archaeon]
MGLEIKNRAMLILFLLIVGTLLASVASRYITRDEPIKHSVSTGKVGSNADGTVWVTEFENQRVIFNYTLPEGAVHSRFLEYSSCSIVAVPSYSQGFELERTENAYYNVYIPEMDASVPLSELYEYAESFDKTILIEGYWMLDIAINDVRVLSKIHDVPFGINGIITDIHKNRTTSILGFILTVEGKHYRVMIEPKWKMVKLIEEISFK